MRAVQGECIQASKRTPVAIQTQRETRVVNGMVKWRWICYIVSLQDRSIGRLWVDVLGLYIVEMANFCAKAFPSYLYFRVNFNVLVCVVFAS